MVFKCKNCGGNTIYSPEKKKMYCPFCESIDSEEQNDSAGDIQICPNCGGEVLVEEYTSATQCKYCDNYLIFNERVEGEFAPNLIIPFQYSKEMVKKLLRDKFKKSIFAPTDFLSEVKLNTMQGDYVPFWLYDYNTQCEYSGEGSRTRVWRVGDMEYTETSIYDIYRNMDIQFDRIPVDASIKMQDDVMDLLEPYEYNQLESFKPSYMSGFEGERYNVNSETVEPRARRKMEEDAHQILSRTISGYTTTNQRHKNITTSDENVNYGLLPVWTYMYTYKDKTYPFYINGQTAKIIGKTPVSSAKVFSYGFTLWGILTAMLCMIAYILY